MDGRISDEDVWAPAHECYGESNFNLKHSEEDSREA